MLLAYNDDIDRNNWIIFVQSFYPPNVDGRAESSIVNEVTCCSRTPMISAEVGFVMNVDKTMLLVSKKKESTCLGRCVNDFLAKSRFYVEISSAQSSKSLYCLWSSAGKTCVSTVLL